MQATAAAERLDAVSVHISGISNALRDFQRQQQQEADPAPTADGMDVVGLE
jgi:hypothetical protein